MNNKKLFSKDFVLVTIGQIISLFGNQILRFALPLHLLNVTNSPALFGIISACSFIPMVILCPIGGILADRVNKRNIMVILDISTACITLLLAILIGKVDIVVLLLFALILLYGIQGTYQPSVQASIPLLTSQEHIMQANAVITLVSSLASLIGPIIGGALYAFIGIMPILYIGIICFLFSGIMEIFINIPFTKEQHTEGVLAIGKKDLKESFNFMIHSQPIIGEVSLIISSINLFISSLIIIGLPILITKYLNYSEKTGNQLYGFAQGAIALGSLIGGISAGIFSKKLKARNIPISLFIFTLTLLPIGIALNFSKNTNITYVIILISCFIMMIIAALVSVQSMAYLQILTPKNLIGKVISCAMCIGICAQPIGQAMYGLLFQCLKDNIYIPFYFAGTITCIICVLTKNIFKKMDDLLKESSTN